MCNRRLLIRWKRWEGTVIHVGYFIFLQYTQKSIPVKFPCQNRLSPTVGGRTSDLQLTLPTLRQTVDTFNQ